MLASVLQKYRAFKGIIARGGGTLLSKRIGFAGIIP